MNITPLNTSDETTTHRKTLLYAPAGWGKTTQAKHYKTAYGPGFILSGESGLASIRSAGIDYLPFSSFDGPVDPANKVFSFVAICRYMTTEQFKSRGYKWVMLDSLTELSDLVMAYAEAKAIADAAAAGKKVNGFEQWGTYKDRLIGACKWLRDLPYQVCITALAKEDTDENGAQHTIPLVQGSAVQSQLPGLFDNVFGGLVATTRAKGADGKVIEDTRRQLVTGPYAGWRCKSRDEHGALKLIEDTASVPEVLKRLDAAPTNR